MPRVRDESGNVTILFALMAPVILGLFALTFDVAILRYNRAQLQIAADAGALAGVDNLPSQTTAKTTAVRIAQANAPQGAPNITSTTDVDLGIYDPAARTFQVTAQSPNAVRVNASRSVQRANGVPMSFAKAAGFPFAFPVDASAIATTGGQFCNYVLDPSVAGAVQLNVGVVLNSTCGLQVDSSSAAAITAVGLFSVNVSATCVVGNVVGLGLGNFTPSPQTGCVSRADPLQALPEPGGASPCQTVPPMPFGGTLNPGCYTGTIAVSGSVTLNPGLYQFQSAKVSLLGTGALGGNGVTLYFDRNSSFTTAGLSQINISAPSSGTYQGIAIFYSRLATGSALTIAGGAQLSINGTIYAPATSLTLLGVSSTSSNYGYLIVDRLNVTGAGVINLSAFASNARRPSAMSSRAVLAQ